MNRGKTIFIIPGFKHLPTNKAYKEIAKILKSQGYLPVPVTIRWRQTTISQNCEYFLKKYKTINSKKKYILGFSFGAMIALLASTKVSVRGLILCSLSPYFREDLSKVNNSWISSLITQRYQDFSKLHCATLAKKIKAKQILMLYGTKEARSLKKRVRQAFGQISSTHKYLIPIKKTEHDIGDRRYLNKIHQIAKQLN
ncbi:MAG: hypothetical protein A2857_03565 [Candidatus Levybacteria bacterium RIFCSPHIGHO2_01_FULL_36_15]|nr:MAG: hypothetical protein A2857_03565 [Candidatus Levybacteria bacterium RIFCSPHIGHO2_01_FULL_36_15]OGH37867.1 MAG: hypothetical protein A2905_02095 [Candidatus Levybacteria bacterium RIFCSPLOWO2_01_FULL_36_10]